MQSVVINRSSIVSERDIFATSSESELLAFYGSLFAIAAADGSVDIDELDLLFKTINLDKFSDSAKTQIQSYTASPPSLSDCLQTLSQSEEPLRLGVMYFLINIAGQIRRCIPQKARLSNLPKNCWRFPTCKSKPCRNLSQTLNKYGRPPLIKIRHQPPSSLLFPSLKLRAFLSI